jgi:hypothetical protein
VYVEQRSETKPDPGEKQVNQATKPKSPKPKKKAEPTVKWSSPYFADGKVIMPMCLDGNTYDLVMLSPMDFAESGEELLDDFTQAMEVWIEQAEREDEEDA